eukprot:CAMPEP_0181124042 /NCGR_PEP_ID=MMETSP1071-20121207/26250_1 /TAXON_ID=35127 /ORGANISM="Thalassiosira sp., Strain NH16" /LENGTH=111 /DNA_ID=CAMNT_0023209281 /DNA_START=162 /DNA_END=494 /DNA_ORIENTATION=+
MPPCDAVGQAQREPRQHREFERLRRAEGYGEQRRQEQGGDHRRLVPVCGSGRLPWYEAEETAGRERRAEQSGVDADGVHRESPANGAIVVAVVVVGGGIIFLEEEEGEVSG